MHVESLKVFCDIARFRSFSQGAAASGLTQSAASHIVAQLEKRMGAQLINRDTRPLTLTPAGQVYYEGCNTIVEQYLELEAAVRHRHSEMAASVQVAAIYSVGLGDMGGFVERFRAQQPNARVQVEYLHPDTVYERVLHGPADFGLVSFPRKSRELTVTPWRDEPMVLACAPDHPLAARPTVHPADLEGARFVGFARGLVIRREVDRFLREQGVTVEMAAEFDNIETMKQGVVEGVGVSLLPEQTLRREVGAGTLAARPLEGCRFVRPMALIQRRGHRLGPAAVRFLDFLRDHGGSPPVPSPERNGHAPHASAAPSRRKR